MKQSFKCLLFPWQLIEGLKNDSLMFKPHFGALIAVLAPFTQWCCLLLYRGLLLHAFYVWLAAFGDKVLNLSIFTLPITGNSDLSGISAAFPCCLLGEGTFLMKVYLICFWPWLFWARQVACYFSKFQTFKQLAHFLQISETVCTRLRLPQGYIASGENKLLISQFSHRHRQDWLAVNFFKQFNWLSSKWLLQG